MATGKKITIYVPAELVPRLPALPKGAVSKICQDALRAAIEKAERERAAGIELAFAED